MLGVPTPAASMPASPSKQRGKQPTVVTMAVFDVLKEYFKMPDDMCRKNTLRGILSLFARKPRLMSSTDSKFILQVCSSALLK